MSSSKSVCAILALACLGVGSAVVQASPYASQISISGNTVTFNLNEDADSVSLKIGSTTTALSATAGFQTFTLPSSTTPFSIKVDKNSAAGWTSGTVLQVGTDTVQTAFGSPRGVAVNQNPGQYFGRIYVSNDNIDTTTKTNTAGVVRQTGAGIYVLNADRTDAVGQGDTALDPVSFGAWGKTGTAYGNAPWHLEVGPDNNLYIADAGAAENETAMLYRTNPDVSAGDYMLYDLPGSNTDHALAAGHGRIYGSPIVHIDNAGAVTVYATDGTLNNGHGYNAIQKYSLGVNPTTPSGPVPVEFVSNPTAAPNASGISAVPSVTTDLAQGSVDGRFYFTENRSAGGQPGLFVVNPTDGSIMWDSLTQTQLMSPGATVDLLTQIRSVAVSPDNKYVAMITDTDALDIVPLTGANGLPDLANMIQITTAFPSTAGFGRDISFDAAGNLYAVSSDNLMLRVFSPGGESSFTTSFDGTKFAFAANTMTVHHPGDTNNDGVVDLTDLNNVLNNFGTTATGNAGDDNSDGVVDLTDLNNVLNNFGTTYAAAALNAVPEPASLSLLGLGAAALIARRRRRA